MLYQDLAFLCKERTKGNFPHPQQSLGNATAGETEARSPRVRAMRFPGQLNPQSFCSFMGENPSHNPTKLQTASRETPYDRDPRPRKGLRSAPKAQEPPG